MTKTKQITGWTAIPTLSGVDIVRQVVLSEPEEIERREYRHPYSDGDAWLPVYDSAEAARRGDASHAI